MPLQIKLSKCLAPIRRGEHRVILVLIEILTFTRVRCSVVDICPYCSYIPYVHVYFFFSFLFSLPSVPSLSLSSFPSFFFACFPSLYFSFFLPSYLSYSFPILSTTVFTCSLAFCCKGYRISLSFLGIDQHLHIWDHCYYF